MTVESVRQGATFIESSREERTGRFFRWAAWSGLSATAAFLVTILVTSVTGGQEAPADTTEIMAHLADVSADAWAHYSYGIAGIALCVLFIPMAVGLHAALRRTTLAWFGSAAVVAGLGILIPAYAASILQPLALPAVVDGGASPDALYAVHAAVTGAADVFFTAGSVLSLGIGPLLWGFEWLRASNGRWLGWTAVATGVTGVTWIVWLVDTPPIAMVLMVNVILSLVVFAGGSTRLLAQAAASGS